MFTCARCGEQKPDSERGSIGWLGQIGLVTIALLAYPLRGAWTAPLCRDCCWGYRFIGIAWLAFLGFIAFFVILMKFVP
jgi:hypothetical protein